MLQYFLNPWLLTGLMGISLPIIVHLFTRRRFDVVQWAAMQFLIPARRTRRRIRLAELLLMLLRVGMIAILALAMARPWLPAGLTGGFRSAGSRSVVFVIDSSDSMSRTDGLSTLHGNAKRRAVEFLQSLDPGDSAALIDARDKPRVVTDSPSQNLAVLADAVTSLPGPAGAADLERAAERALALLAKAGSAAREIVVLTDRQRAGWEPDSADRWTRFDKLLELSAVRPRLWVVDVSDAVAPPRQNVAVEVLRLSRDLTVPGFPLRAEAQIRGYGGTIKEIPVQVSVNGQVLAQQSQTVRLDADGRTRAEFEVALPSVGTQIVSIEALVPGDPIPSDNVSHASVRVTDALPVLLINGTESRDLRERETFFAAIALSSLDHGSPRIAARVVDATAVTTEDIHSAVVVLTADVADLPESIPAELAKFVAGGGGLFVCTGPNTTPESFHKLFHTTGLISGAELTRTRTAQADVVRIAQTSLQPGWMTRFRSESGRSFLKAGFQQWWLTQLTAGNASPADGPAAAGGGDSGERTSSPAADVAAVRPGVLALLTTGDPILIGSQYGRGSVLVWTSSLSRRWNDLSTRSDYLPFLHEAVFQTAGAQIRRNLDFAEPLIALTQPTSPAGPAPGVTDSLQFRTPENRIAPGTVTGDPANRQVVLPDTYIPGIYQQLRSDAADDTAVDQFVVNYDRSEADVAELSPGDQDRLASSDRMRFVRSMAELARNMYGGEARFELWPLLVWIFPVLLTGELLMTRRLVGGAHQNEMPVRSR